MLHSDALAIAQGLVEKLAPHCERIEIAGSVRRGKPEVKDIEIVAQPRLEPVTDLLGNVVESYSALIGFPWREIGEIRKGGERYKQFALPENINLDLFLVLPPAQFGVLYAIRTGPAEFSQWLVTQRRKGGALPSNAVVAAGAVHVDGEIVPMPEETDFFEFCDLPWIEPAERKARW